jgi:hypothetical protein
MGISAMNETKGSAHTPGPWSVRYGVCRNDHPDTSADVHGPQGQFVADCGCHEWANANAGLIAAAPDLLALVKAIAADASAYPWHTAANAVIAKAEGRDGR